MSACQRAFDRLQGNIATGYGAPQQVEEPSSTPARIKKRAQAVAPSIAADTNAAGFSTFATVNDPTTPNAPSSSAQSPGGKPQKKRGRPSKGDIEARHAEAAERGEVYQHPEPKRARKPQKDPAAPVTMTFAGGQEGDPAAFGGLIAEPTPGSSATKRRAPRPKVPKEPKVTAEAIATAASALEGPSEAQPQLGATESQVVMQSQPEQSLSASLYHRADPIQPRTSEEGIARQPQIQQQQPSPKDETEPLQTAQTSPPQASPSSNVETYRPLPTSPQAEAEPYQTPYQPDSAV